LRTKFIAQYQKQSYSYFHPQICYKFYNDATYMGELEIAAKLIENSTTCQNDSDSTRTPIFEIISVQIGYAGLTDTVSNKKAEEITVKIINDIFNSRLKGKFLCSQCLEDVAYINSLLKIYTSTLA